MLQRLRRINAERGTTVLIANHRLAEVRHLGGRLVVLLQGRIAADGEVARIFADPPGEAVRGFLRGYGAFSAGPDGAIPAGEGA